MLCSHAKLYLWLKLYHVRQLWSLASSYLLLKTVEVLKGQARRNKTGKCVCVENVAEYLFKLPPGALCQ